MWRAKHILQTWSPVHQPIQMWIRSKDFSSCAKRGPGGLSNYQVFSDKVTWLFNLPVFLVLVILFIIMANSYPFEILLLMFFFFFFAQWVFVRVCREGRRVSKWENGGQPRVCAWEKCGFFIVWWHKGVRKRVRERYSAFAKTVFLVWMPVYVRNHAITMWKDSSRDLSFFLSPSHSVHFYSNLHVLLSDWTLRSLFQQQLTKSSVLSILLIRLA